MPPLAAFQAWLTWPCPGLRCSRSACFPRWPEPGLFRWLGAIVRGLGGKRFARDLAALAVLLIVPGADRREPLEPYCSSVTEAGRVEHPCSMASENFAVCLMPGFETSGNMAEPEKLERTEFKASGSPIREQRRRPVTPGSCVRMKDRVFRGCLSHCRFFRSG